MTTAPDSARADAVNRIAAKLERLPVQRRSLVVALRAFGEDFECRGVGHRVPLD